MLAAIVKLTILSIVLFVFRLLYEYRRDRSLPPGPPRLPLIGNLHQVSAELPSRTFHEWIKKYGPIISAQFGGTTVIIIGNATVAHDLLDKRGNIYSDRPRMVMAGENLTKGLHLLLRQYDDDYRTHQRLGSIPLSPRASQIYYPLQDLESKQLLFDFLSTNDFPKIFERYAASVVYSLCYGSRLSTGDEQCLKDAHKVQDNFVYVLRVGTWIVDALPFLNVLPPALAPWKRTTEEFYKIESSLHVKNMRQGVKSKSWNWSKHFYWSKEAENMGEEEIAYSLGVLADAGLDTTSVQMRVFTLAALSYPEFIVKAQKELDEVVGPDRLPSLDDKTRLPYIVAVVEEVLRWRSIVPQGIPHATMQEDTYMGYRIPKGATVLGLHWAMSLDGKEFERPLEFLPERWLEKPDPDNRFVNFFGFGRRICTGRHIARNSIFLLIARLLWGFNIQPALDKDGKKIEVDDTAFNSNLVSGPIPFKAVFEPRTAHARNLIEKEWNSAEKNVDVILDSIHNNLAKAGLKV